MHPLLLAQYDNHFVLELNEWLLVTIIWQEGFRLPNKFGRFGHLTFLEWSRTSSVGKVDDSESGGPRFESRVVLWTLVVLDNDHLLSLDYEYGNGALEYVKHSWGTLQM